MRGGVGERLTTRAVGQGLTLRARLAFTALLTTLLGLGLTPLAAPAATAVTTAAAAPAAGPHTERDALAAPVHAATPQPLREQPAGGFAAVLPTGAPLPYPTYGPAAVRATDRAPQLPRELLPEVRGPPATTGR